MSLNVTHAARGEDAFVVYPAGSLSSDTAPELENTLSDLIARGPRLIVMDLEQLDYISSAGIRVLLKAKKELRENAGRLSFMNLQPPIKKVFEIINALPSLQVFASVQELDDYLDAMQRSVGSNESARI